MTTVIKDAPAAAVPAELDENTRSQVSAAVNEGVRAGIKAEQDRRDGIADTGRKLGLPQDFVDQALRSETPLATFREKAIEEASKRANEAPTNSFNTHFGAPAVITDPKREVQKGEMAARMIRCYAGAKRAGMSPVEFSRTVFKDEAITRAMSAGLEASGGAMVPEQWAAEIIELLRPQAAVRGANPTIMPMPGGNMTVPRVNGGSNAHYVGENTDITSGDISTGDVKLSAKKLAAIVPISNDLIRFSSYAADQVVRDDIVAAVAVAEDVAFIRGAGTAFTPKGMRNWAQADNIIAASAGQTAANIIVDTNKLLNALQGNNVRMIRPTWFMSFRTYNFLNSVTTTTGAFVYRDEMNGGKFRGYPFRLTNNIPNNLSTGVGSESELYLADMADCVIGEVPGFMIDVSQDAVYTADGTNLISAFSRDQTVIRVIEQHDFALRHDASVAVLTQVTWA
jgi:HK97 family phage major capsid protein